MHQTRRHEPSGPVIHGATSRPSPEFSHTPTTDRELLLEERIRRDPPGRLPGYVVTRSHVKRLA
jgi:hypothetical protein